MTYEELQALCESYFAVSHETFINLKILVYLVLQEQQNQNLIAPSTIETIWHRHIFDSLQLVRFIKADASILDLGSGAGFPGLVLSLALNAKVTLVESEGHKAEFLRRAAEQLQCQATICAERIEQISLSQMPNVVTARALAPLTKLLGLVQQWVSDGVTGVFLKGKTWQTEVDLARKTWRFDLESYPSLSDEQAQILIVRDLRKR